MATTGIMSGLNTAFATPTSATAANATAANATAANAKAADATATGYNATTRTVDPTTETVQGQLRGIMSSGSPLITMGRTSANQTMADRGLLNSSLGLQAADAAAYQAALPIAQQDANTYSTTAGQNQTALNTASQFNAANATDVSKFNAGNETDVSKLNAANATDVSKLNATNATDVSKLNAANETDVSKTNAAAQTSTSQFNAGEQNKLTAQGLDNQTKIALQQMSNDSAANLANIEANYKTLMQTNASASDYYKQISKDISDIMQNSDMNATAKTNAINNQIQLLQSGLAVIGKVGNLDITSLLDFSELPTNTTTADGLSDGTYTAPDGSIWASEDDYLNSKKKNTNPSNARWWENNSA